MPTTSITPNHDVVVTEIDIAAPLERVFRALTDAGQLKRWFTGPACPVHTWEMDARLGGCYRYTTEKGSVVVNNVREFECHGEIIEYDPPRVLAYTWIANWHDELSRRTVVPLGIDIELRRHAREGHAQRPHRSPHRSQRLHRRLARRAREPQEVFRELKMTRVPHSNVARFATLGRGFSGIKTF
jgi:uncharacterized protein YndB with AHSA1/START domain